MKLLVQFIILIVIVSLIYLAVGYGFIIFK